jgi:GH25 family lysozyme M1 (1,4-beta-N-acetylmuramidase)
MTVPTGYSLIIDRAHWEPWIDAWSLSLGGVVGVISKLSDGSSEVDETAFEVEKAALAMGLKNGVYHWTDPIENDAPQVTNAVVQINRLNKPPFVIAVDMEQWWADWAKWSASKKDPSVVVPVLSPQRISVSNYYVAKQLQTYFPSVPVIIYTSAHFIEEFCPQAKEWLPEFGWWLPRWPNPPAQTTKITWEDFIANRLPPMVDPVFPAGWTGPTSWVGWQFSGDDPAGYILPGMCGTVMDVNYFKMDELGGDPTPPPSIITTVTTFNPSTRIRSTPTTSTDTNVIIGCPAGTVWPVAAEAFKDDAGYTWYNVQGWVRGDVVTPNR